MSQFQAIKLPAVLQKEQNRQIGHKREREGASLWDEFPIARDHLRAWEPLPILQIRDIGGADPEMLAHLSLTQTSIKPPAPQFLRRWNDSRPAAGAMRQGDGATGRHPRACIAQT